MKVRLIMERASKNLIVLKQLKTEKKQQQKNMSLVIMFVATATHTGK